MKPYVRKKVRGIKIPDNITGYSESSNVQPVILKSNSVENLTDHMEVQVNEKKIIVAIKEMEMIKKLGEGQFGVVEHMRHIPSQLEFAVKQVRCSMNDKNQSRILNDLNISMRCTQCPYVVISYGAMFQGGDVWICMEILDSSLDKFYKQVETVKTIIPEKILAFITFCVTTALEYLHKELKIMHRDVKPSNILIDKCGQVKVCDFGISGNLVNSLANTNVGSQPYLAPERIHVQDSSMGFSIRSDVWSLGITVLELASLKFPYRKCSEYDQAVSILKDPSPSLPATSVYSNSVRTFIERCLIKDVRDRASYLELLGHDMLSPFTDKNYVLETQNAFADFVITILGE